MSRAPTARDWALLGLRAGAGEEEIRAAYRRLAKVHHPDRNPGDAGALATFQQLSESYAVLRQHLRARTSSAPSPLAAARRTRPAAPGGPTASLPVLAELPAGEAVWVAPDAVLVGPDRAAALRPDAMGSAYPSADRAIRVERRGDGLHVFMPPQPSARWALGSEAETHGLAVAGLWVGGRRDEGGGQAARVPRRLLGRTVAELPVGGRGWVAAEALAVQGTTGWSLDLAEPVTTEPHRATPVRVQRDQDGFRVQSDLPAERFAPAGDARRTVAPVLSAVLGGVSQATVTAPS